MTLRVIGAGLGRTGTLSLKLALERLLGEPCYHMLEVFATEGHIGRWHAIAEGGEPDWDDLFAGYGAVVDWPACGFWPALADAYPDALVLLSTRADAPTWFKSASRTIFDHHSFDDPGLDEFSAMWRAVAAMTFDGDYTDEAIATAGYERHNARVRDLVAADQLIEYQPGDGWAPLCAALGVPVPDEPFPHTNSTEEFRERAGLED